MPDERVEAAIANWAPRFVSQGVDFNDFERVTARVERWAEWRPAWVENGDAHAARAHEAEERRRAVTAGEAWNHAALSYHFAKFVWMVDMEQYRVAADRAVAALREVHRLLDPEAERLELPFEGGTMHANLRRPGGSQHAPLVLLLPGLDSTKEEFFEWENVFLQRGLARVSLGGYYAPRAAAFEPRVRAAVGVSGPWNFGEVWDERPVLTKETFAHHSGARNLEEARTKAFELDLSGVAERIEQPLLIVTGKLDRLVR